MKLPTASKNKLAPRSSGGVGGFTLIEIMTVIGLFTIIAGVGMFFDFDNFRAYSFHSERDTLISTLQHARAEAVSSICRGPCDEGKPHGVKILDNKFIIFQGTDYVSADRDYDAIMDANPNMLHGGLPEVVFEQLSGDVDTPGDITLTDNYSGRKSTISINSEGQILWTDERI